jgi:hypothetical protein
MSKQTAVEWLVEELFKKIDYIQVDPRIINQAKAMEREQIIDAYDKNKMGRVDYGEQYYNETFSK